MIKHILSFTSLLCLTAFSLMAQYSISGKILNEKNEPIAFANILLLESKDSSFVSGIVSDESGSFETDKFTAGDYLLKISFLGYKDLYQNVKLSENLYLEEIFLEEESALLEMVTVSERRTIISKKIDRLVFDVENSSKASQGDALDLLAVTPGIRVRNESVNMIGKSKVSILVNDKMIRMSEEEVATFLMSIASEDISKIEVISSPPAKYEAEGNGGLINIQLKTAKSDSWNLSLRSDFRQRSNPRFANGIGFNFNKKKLSIATSLYYQNGIYRQNQEDYSHFPDALWFSDSTFDRAFDQFSGRIDIAYEMNPKWTIGGQYIYSYSDQNTNETPSATIRNYSDNEILGSLNTIGEMDQIRNIHAINLFQHFKLDSSGKKIQLNIDFFNFDDWEDKQYEGTSVDQLISQKSYYRGVNQNEQRIINSSVSLDFELPSQFADFETGFKFTNLNSGNEIDFFNSGVMGEPIEDFILEKNDFEFIENIQAIYLSAQKELSEKFSLKMGLRMEATQNTTTSLSQNFENENNYVKFFPTFYLGFQPKENTSFSLSYNRRISRAPFYMLTPNPWFANPFQFVVGNPFIQPSFADNIELGSRFKNLFVSAYFNKEENVFTQVPIPDADKSIMEFKFQNFININRLGLNANYLFEHFKWWSCNLSADINYSTNDYFNDGLDVKKTGYNSSVSLNNDFFIKADKSLLLNVAYWYSPRGIDEFWNVQPTSNLSASLQFLLLEKKLKLTLRANDIFRTQLDRISTTVDGIFQDNILYYDSRFVGIALNYSLGNKNISSKRNRVGNQDERNRAGQF